MKELINCEICNKRVCDWVVHHKSYVNDDLLYICRQCHGMIHSRHGRSASKYNPYWIYNPYNPVNLLRRDEQKLSDKKVVRR